MITIYYVIYDSAEAAPSAAQIASGLAWAPAVAAGSDEARSTAGVQTFPPATDLPRGDVRVAFVAHDDIADEYSNVAISDPLFIPRKVLVPQENANGAEMAFYPPEGGATPLTEAGFSAWIAESPAGATPQALANPVDIVSGVYEVIDDAVLKTVSVAIVYLALEKGDRHMLTRAVPTPEAY